MGISLLKLLGTAGVGVLVAAIALGSHRYLKQYNADAERLVAPNSSLSDSSYATRWKPGTIGYEIKSFLSDQNNLDYQVSDSNSH